MIVMLYRFNNKKVNHCENMKSPTIYVHFKAVLTSIAIRISKKIFPTKDLRQKNLGKFTIIIITILRSPAPSSYSYFYQSLEPFSQSSSTTDFLTNPNKTSHLYYKSRYMYNTYIQNPRTLSFHLSFLVVSRVDGRDVEDIGTTGTVNMGLGKKATPLG